MELFDKLYAGAKWGVGVSIDRTNGLPLDRNSIFPSYDLAVAYAAKNETAIAAELTKLGIDTKISNNAYAGQVLAVVTETETAIYYIDANMQLQEVGGKVSVDNGSIVADEDGKLYLYGFTAAAAETLPRVKVVDGVRTIEWVPIRDIIVDTNTVTTVSAANNSVDVTIGTNTAAEKAYSVKVNVSATEGNAISLVEDGLYVATPVPYDDTKVKEDIAANTAKFADYYTKTETDSEIAEQIAAINHATSVVVYSVNTENNTYVEVEGGEAKAAQPNVVYYVKDNSAINDVYKEYLLIGDKLTLVGDTSTDLSNYYDKDDIDGKVETLEDAIEEAKQAGTDASSALNTYKGEVTNALALKADAATAALKTEVEAVDAKFASYTTTEGLNTLLAGKADNGTVSAIDNRVVALETDNTTNKENITKNANAISAHATEFATFKGSVEAKQAGYDTAIKALQDKDVTIDSRLNALEKADEAHDNKIANLEKADEDLSTEIGGVSGRVSAIEEALNTETTGISARLTAVETKANENATAISVNAGEITAIKTAIGNVKGDGVEASGIKGDIEALDARMDAVEEVAAGAATTAGNAEAKVNSLQEQFDELVAEGGEPNTISTLQVNGTSITPVSKVANVAIAIDGKNSSIETVADAANGKVTATIKKVSTDLLVSGDDVLILDCGNA